MGIIPRFQRDRVTSREAETIASDRVIGVQNSILDRKFEDIERSVRKSDERVAAVENSLLSEIRSLAKRNLHDHLDTLVMIRNRAMDAEKFSAAVNAEKARGQVFGFYNPERLGASEDPNSLEDLSVAELTALLEKLENGSK